MKPHPIRIYAFHSRHRPIPKGWRFVRHMLGNHGRYSVLIVKGAA